MCCLAENSVKCNTIVTGEKFIEYCYGNYFSQRQYNCYLNIYIYDDEFIFHIFLSHSSFAWVFLKEK